MCSFCARGLLAAWHALGTAVTGMSNQPFDDEPLKGNVGSSLSLICRKTVQSLVRDGPNGRHGYEPRLIHASADAWHQHIRNAISYCTQTERVEPTLTHCPGIERRKTRQLINQSHA